ncbi:helix-turn-helix transcriptional regulator [Planctomicrobium sp. SH664]|uniref:helix-turn-helix transcriptional regulator n=1 Tax=Planctomicrobium sp. SH664 TaxID=3448125 RepID=UPI003F5B6745
MHLLERLQTGRTHSTDDLADFCKVSRRTVFRDLKTLQESGVRVLYDAQRQGYWIPSHVYLPPAELSLSETLSLIVLAQEASHRERGIPFLDVAREASFKLQGNLPPHLQHYVSELTAAIKIEMEPLARQPDGREHYQRVLEAITGKKKLRIRYHSVYEKGTIQTLVSPYHLLFRRHTWYLIGRSSLHREVRTFHTGRIEHSELTEESFTVPPRFNLRRYFGNAWNLIKEAKSPARVVIRFQPMVATNVSEVTWHSTQQLSWNEDGTLDFTVDVDGINEISWWILGYGDQARVLEPPELEALIHQRAEAMVAQYRRSEPTSSSNR